MSEGTDTLFTFIAARFERDLWADLHVQDPQLQMNGLGEMLSHDHPPSLSRVKIKKKTNPEPFFFSLTKESVGVTRVNGSVAPTSSEHLHRHSGDLLSSPQ